MLFRLMANGALPRPLVIRCGSAQKYFSNSLLFMLNLDDKTIRKSLITRLAGLAKAPKAILEELRVHNGNAIADVVAIHRYAHCYEIKGETDSIHRILKQRQFYDLAFKRITLVTTNRHIQNALRLAPTHWGIMVASEKYNSIAIRYVRSAQDSPSFDPRVALLTLWRSELIEVALSLSDRKLEKLNRTQLSSLIASNLDQKRLGESIGEKLISRSAQSMKSLNM